MSLTFELDLDIIELNQRTTYLGQTLFSSKVIVRPQWHTQTHYRTDCSTWTTKVVDKDYVDINVCSYTNMCKHTV